MRQVLLPVSPFVDVAHRAVEQLHRAVAGVAAVSAGAAGFQRDRHRDRLEDRSRFKDTPHGVIAHGIRVCEILPVVGI